MGLIISNPAENASKFVRRAEKAQTWSGYTGSVRRNGSKFQTTMKNLKNIQNIWPKSFGLQTHYTKYRKKLCQILNLKYNKSCL